MFNRVEICSKSADMDGKAQGIELIIEEDLGLKVGGIKIVEAYNFRGDFNEEEILTLRDSLFCDKVYQDSFVGFHHLNAGEYDFAIEVAYKTGVTDNVGKTASKGIEYILKRGIKESDVKSSTLYLFKGDTKKDDIKLIASKALCNTLIEDYYIFYKTDAKKSIDYKFNFEITEKINPYEVVNLEVSDEALMKISRDGVLSLSLEEMKAVRDYYRDEKVKAERKLKSLPNNPTDIELELFAQTWSEHCKHKIFAAEITYENGGEVKVIDSLFKTYIKKSAEIIKENRDDLLSLFKDNSGVVKFNDEWAYCVKVETHNSPSALDPYGGAMTGIVGVNRDILGTGIGAYPIFNTDVFCFGDPFIDNKDVPDGLLHPRRIFRGVHRGIKDGGNESGIPTVNGSISFDNSFLGKPLVFCGTGGLLPLKVNGKDSYEKYTKSGDLIVMVGGKIGKDGIHGATFSSDHLSEKSPTSAVQIGDPITQKKMIDFIIEARDKDLYSGLTDNGAGGLASSVGEMATFTNGAVLRLEKCPLKYSGLKPWEILLSEAQERMTVSVPKDKIDEFLRTSSARDVESTVIGEFTDNGLFECFYEGKIISSVNMNFLHDGVPKYRLKAQWKNNEEKKVEFRDEDIAHSIKNLLKRPNIASKEYWVRMYDHEVGARTVVKPFMGKSNDGPSDGAVLKIFPNANEGLVVTHGIVPRYSEYDTYSMAANAVDEAVRQAVCLGANPDKLVGLDNFCWADPVESPSTPDGKYKLAQLVRACEALYDLTIKYNCPCISGKDSMKNDYLREGKKISILQTLLFTVVGKVDDINKAVTFYFKNPDTKIYLIGDTKSELAASEYYLMKNVKGGFVPKVEPDKALANYKKLYKAINDGLILSAHDLSDGGLSVALIEAAFSGKVGCDIDLSVFGGSLDLTDILFSESPSRILVSVSAESEKRLLDIFDKDSILYLGKTANGDNISIRYKDKIVLNENLTALKNIWKNALVF